MAKLAFIDGGRFVPMVGFERQKRVSRNPKKKARLVHFRRYEVPSETEYALRARLALAHAAIEMRGRRFEEVIDNIVTKCGGKRYGRSEIYSTGYRYRQADANVKRMEEKLRIMTGGATPAGAAGIPIVPM